MQSASNLGLMQPEFDNSYHYKLKTRSTGSMNAELSLQAKNKKQ
jgi:hypothetical protein